MKVVRLLGTLGLLSLGTGCTAASPRPAAPPPPVAVETERAAIVSMPEPFESGGTVRPRLTATVASRVMAPVAGVHYRAGDRVRRGATLVTLDARQAAADAARAKAASSGAVEAIRAADSDTRAAESRLQLMRATHDRLRMLHDTRSATAQELDQAVAGLSGAEAQLAGAQSRASAAAAARDAAEASLDAARIALSYAVLTAPFDGTVAERFVDPGSMATPGAPLMILEDQSALRVEVQLDEARARLVTVGQAVEVRVDGEQRSDWKPARIAEIGRMDSASHNFLVKLDVADGAGLRSGLFARARFAGMPRSTLSVADASLVRRGQLAFVFAVGPDGIARLRPVLAGVTTAGRVEILAGIKQGDLVVLKPPAALPDGARVTGTAR